MELPLRIHSASFQHPLSIHWVLVEIGWSVGPEWNFLATRARLLLETLPSGQVGGDQNTISGNVAKWAGGKQKSEARVRLG